MKDKATNMVPLPETIILPVPTKVAERILPEELQNESGDELPENLSITVLRGSGRKGG